MNTRIIAAVAALALAGCAPNPAELRGAVEDFGFTDVRLGDHAWFGCSRDDTFRQRWTGRNAAGAPVSGVVCGGFGKGYTVRITGRAGSAGE
ncbi:hypothetical protein LH128_01197 [Sphingomonas sp. LH128]|uniref:hypothetical protein n=1 Tax=Sphingomonas sp. LH128 TaxID=473781 RepID=UPI00027CC207|nr:hypothetical protein [Sphingomonas sp. LH128]EJU14949.1 hypothetical protein LH128_01197 [Sphingomonas sp. LH128]